MILNMLHGNSSLNEDMFYEMKLILPFAQAMFSNFVFQVHGKSFFFFSFFFFFVINGLCMQWGELAIRDIV